MTEQVKDIIVYILSYKKCQQVIKCSKNIKTTLQHVQEYLPNNKVKVTQGDELITADWPKHKHYKIWATHLSILLYHAQKHPKSHALVLEDDVVFVKTTGHVNKVLRKIINQKKDWMFVNIGAIPLGFMVPIVGTPFSLSQFPVLAHSIVYNKKYVDFFSRQVFCRPMYGEGFLAIPFKYRMICTIPLTTQSRPPAALGNFHKIPVPRFQQYHYSMIYIIQSVHVLLVTLFLLMILTAFLKRYKASAILLAVFVVMCILVYSIPKISLKRPFASKPLYKERYRIYSSLIKKYTKSELVKAFTGFTV